MYQDLPYAKGEVSWFKTVELAADQKSDQSARNLENSKNQNLYKENRDQDFFRGPPKFNESS